MLSNDIAWYPKDLEDTSRWIHELTDAELGELDAALNAAKSAGHSCETLTKESFPLDVLGETLQSTLESLENDLGVYVLRGVQAEKYSKDELRLMYWGIGLHMGTAVSQSNKGDVLGDVKNFGDAVSSATGRGYMSKDNLGFHTDTCDVVGLFVLQTAKSGGLSAFCSSIAIRDEIANTRPDLFEVLQQPFYWSWKGQEAEGELPYYTQPIFTYQDGRFSSRNIATHVWAAEDLEGVPPLTDVQREAMSLLNSLANEPRFHYTMMFERGDMQFINNHVAYHARTEFEDFPEDDRRRHLLRMWLAVPNSRKLSPAMSAIYQDQNSGAVRGGFPSRVSGHVYETKVSAL